MEEWRIETESNAHALAVPRPAVLCLLRACHFDWLFSLTAQIRIQHSSRFRCTRISRPRAIASSSRRLRHHPRRYFVGRIFAFNILLSNEVVQQASSTQKARV
jgi:hypothetical protein